MNLDNITIEETFNPTSSDIDYLTQKINEESKSQNIHEEAYPFGIILRNKSSTPEEAKTPKTEEDRIGGCNGSVVYGSIYTDQLWVHPQFRGTGLGKLLMEKVHELGKKTNCKSATVGTMSFQGAQEFYESLGYQVEFVREGYVHDSKMIFLKKIL